MIRKSLICITTCNRLNEVKKYVLPYIDFCNKHIDFDFLLALDGNNPEYLDFCNEFQIPLLYSEEREGVGISKNRVLSLFPNYNYYFFIDDDIELIDSTIFFENIYISEALNIPHLSGIVYGDNLVIECFEKYRILKGYKAGGYFNFFKADVLFKVGGWHTHFAKFKRYGHSEHSYRFYNIGIQKYPMISVDSTTYKISIHNPPHVTVDNTVFNHLHPDEQDLINQRLTYFPITTLSTFYFNGYNMSINGTIAKYLEKNPQKYPLIKGYERIKCFSEYYFFKFSIARSIWKKIYFFSLSLILRPINNNEIKHYIKTKLLRK